MAKIAQPLGCNDVKDNVGCAYVLDELEGVRVCGAVPQRASSYCPYHHALCYIVSGSKAEVDRLREVEALATAVGGRRASQRAGPSRKFLKRLEGAVRDLS
jgi:hypothetical protein